MADSLRDRGARSVTVKSVVGVDLTVSTEARRSVELRVRVQQREQARRHFAARRDAEFREDRLKVVLHGVRIACTIFVSRGVRQYAVIMRGTISGGRAGSIVTDLIRGNHPVLRAEDAK